ncbi:MAG: hypothetical protein ACKVWR_00150 [Acidimicrobiales bacterium]
MSNEIETLLREREGYVARNLPARVAAVDAALHALGYAPPAVEPLVETAGAGEASQRSGKRTRS